MMDDNFGKIKSNLHTLANYVDKTWLIINNSLLSKRTEKNWALISRASERSFQYVFFFFFSK